MPKSVSLLEVCVMGLQTVLHMQKMKMRMFVHKRRVNRMSSSVTMADAYRKKNWVYNLFRCLVKFMTNNQLYSIRYYSCYDIRIAGTRERLQIAYKSGFCSHISKPYGLGTKIFL